MSLDLTLERNSSVALYQQIAEQLKDRICTNRLPSGARLPTIRQLAAELEVTRLTIQNAYNELQSSGWIESVVGRGTFVSEAVQSHVAMQATMQNQVAQNHNPQNYTRQSFTRPSLSPDAVISDILELGQVAGVRSMASASPDPKLFPEDEFWGALTHQRQDVNRWISYSSSQGDPVLRTELATLLQKQGINAYPDDILITSGVTQGLSLIAQALGQPGDVVLVEQPTYLGLLHTLKTLGLHPVCVPMDEGGPIIDELERLVTYYRPRFFYTIPTFQNPTGICMSRQRRQELLELAERHHFLIVEDDIYAPLAYDTPSPTALKALDRSGSVIYINSVSKLLMPGLRIGYVVAPHPLYERLLSLRRASDLCSPALFQRTFAHFLQTGALQRHLKRVLPIYRRRRDLFIDAMKFYMPKEVTWIRPAGGFCCWLTLPRHQALNNLHQAALQQGWAFTPGEVFLAQPSSHQHMRICFGRQNEEVNRAGVELLSQLIKERLTQPATLHSSAYDWTPLV